MTLTDGEVQRVGRVVGDVGQDGAAGRDADVAAVHSLVASEVTRAVSGLPAPKDGRDGKDVDEAALTRMVAQRVDAAVLALPKPRDGAPGTNGKDADIETIRLLIGPEVQRAVAALPTPSPGTPGTPGKDGKDGITHEQLEAAAVRLLKSWMSEAKMEGRTLVLGSHRFDFPIPHWKGFWKEGASYDLSDVVTLGGSSWICLEANTKDKPGTGTRGWDLMAKHGRDGSR